MEANKNLLDKIKLFKDATVAGEIHGIRGLSGHRWSRGAEEIVNLDVVPLDKCQVLVIRTPHEVGDQVVRLRDLINDFINCRQDKNALLDDIINWNKWVSGYYYYYSPVGG